ncbi:unnamed protein product [Closterium sp. Naga37s-1]|nr:unnamed protein product [Closterium sp. Naga37s-1]
MRGCALHLSPVAALSVFPAAFPALPAVLSAFPAALPVALPAARSALLSSFLLPACATSPRPPFMHQDYDAKLTDFGMVRVGPDRQLRSIVHTDTFFLTRTPSPSPGRLGVKSDVYSFGVLLLELLEVYSDPRSLSRRLSALPLSPPPLPQAAWVSRATSTPLAFSC